MPRSALLFRPHKDRGSYSEAEWPAQSSYDPIQGMALPDKAMEDGFPTSFLARSNAAP